MTVRSRATRAVSPFRLDLDQQRKRAKELAQGLRAGDAEALRRFRRHHPDVGAAGRTAVLSEAQLVIARELGLPSWAKLKAHILAMQQARDSIAARAGSLDDPGTLHIRCGSDLQSPLAEAGFVGDILEYTDPLCQGPVPDRPDWLSVRADFLSRSYGGHLGRDAAAILADLQAAEDGLHAAARNHERIVLWFEHDSYDQLILARCLARFAEVPPQRLELITVDRFPGSTRFIGIGQLPPEALRLLWGERLPVSEHQLAIGRVVWNRLRLADPTPLASMARAGLPQLPQLAKALRRHCQELPWLRDGLGLTERLVLRVLTEGPKTAGEIYRDLMMVHEPLPWLSDLMFLSVIDSMKRAEPPALVGPFDGEDRQWPRERLTVTALGRAVLDGGVDWLSLAPPERWLGGVHISPAGPCWRWDDQASTIVLAEPPIPPHPL